MAWGGHTHERAAGVTGGNEGLAALEQVWEEDREPPMGQGGRHAWSCVKENRGGDMLVAQGSWVPTCLISGCRLLVQAAPSSQGRAMGTAGDLPARGLCPRGYVVPLGRGCTPNPGRLLPPVRLKPCAQGSGQL